MGFFTEKAKQGLYDRFIPLELNEDNVNTIFRRCLIKENTPKDDIIIEHYLFLKQNGFDKDSSLFYCSKSELEKNFKSIAYILGQLYDAHNTKTGYFYLKNFSLNYKGLPWLTSPDIDKIRSTILSLIALGSTAQNEKGIVLIGAIEKDVQACSNMLVVPTLSPKDPNFKEWSESEEGKKILARFQD